MILLTKLNKTPV